MDQVLVSYVLAKLTKVAEVRPGDVQTSLRHRSIVLRNVSLRTEKLNEILPIPLDTGDVPEMTVHLPNPTTSDPLRVDMRHPRAVLPLDISAKPTARSMEEILKGITLSSILGEPIHESDTDECPSMLSSVSLADDAMGHVPKDGDLCALSSDMSEDDLMSCHSFSSDAESSSNGSRTRPADPLDDERPSGLFSFIRRRAAASMEWIWQRPTIIAITDLTLVLPCDAQKGVCFKFKIESFTVTIEPKQHMDREELKVVTFDIHNACVLADTGESAPTVVSVESLVVRVTTVTGARSGAVLRKNVAVTLNGNSSLVANELSLFALVTCKVTRDIMLALPPYRRPFTALRKQRLLWPYVASCIIEHVRDQRRRYNLNLSHIRFFSQARERYLQLLNVCHRSHTVHEHQHELAETEQDLHYADVILFLRQKVQQRYNTRVTTSLQPVSEETSPDTQGAPTVASSLHLDIELFRVCLPAATCAAVSGLSVVVRNHENITSIRDISISTMEGSQQLCRALGDSQEVKPLLLLQNHTTDSVVEHRIVLTELCLRLRIQEVHNVILPLLDALQQVGLHERIVMAAPRPPSLPHPEQLPLKKLFAAVPRVEIHIDSMHLLIDRLAISVTGDHRTPKLGCSLAEVSISTGEGGSYLLSPVSVAMLSNDDISVTAIDVLVNADSWEHMRTLREIINDVMNRIPPQLLQSMVAQPSDLSEVSLSQLEQIRQLAQWKRNTHAQRISLCRARVVFDPLAATLMASDVSITHTLSASGKKEGRHISIGPVSLCISNAAKLRALFTLDEGIHVYSTGGKAASTLVQVGEVNGTYESSEGVSRKLAVASCVEVIARQNIQYASVGVLSFLDSVHTRSFQFLMKDDLYSTRYIDRPFRGALLQLAVEVERIHVGAISAVPFASLGQLGAELFAFACDELIPVHAYRLFFSSLTDLAINIDTSSCLVDLDDDTQLALAVGKVSSPVDPWDSKDLAGFAPLLPNIQRDSTVVISNDVKELYMSITSGSLAVSLRAGNDVGVFASLEVSATALRIPVVKPDFWCPAIQAVTAPPTSGSLQSAQVLLGALDPDEALGSLGLRGIRFSMAPKTPVVTPPLPTSTDPEERDPTPTSDSESCFSIDPESAALTVGVKSWSLCANFANDVQRYIGLVDTLSRVAAAAEATRRPNVFCQSISDREVDVDEVGNIYFANEEEIIVVDGCTFTSNNPHRCLVVCERTAVVFRHCVFRCPRGDGFFIRTAPSSSVYAMEDCTTVSDPSPLPPITPTTAPTNLSIILQKGSATFQLSPSARLQVMYRSVTVDHNTSRRCTSSHLRLRGMRTEYVEGTSRISVCSNLSLDLDVSHRCRSNALQLNFTTSVGEVVVPLAVHALSPLRGITEGLQGRFRAHRSNQKLVVPPAPGRLPQSQLLPYASWKVLCSSSAINVTLVLPNAVPIVRVALSNAFLWSTKDPLAGEAHFETRLALHGISVWESRVLSDPCLIGFQGKISDTVGVALRASVSPLDVSMTIQQAQRLATLTAHAGDAARASHTARVYNQTGAEVTLRTVGGELLVVMKEQLIAGADRLAIEPIVSWKGSLVQKEQPLAVGREASESEGAVSLVETVATTSDGARLHISRVVQCDLTESIYLRTMLQVRNGTPFQLTFTGDGCGAQSIVAPYAVSCIQEDLLVATSLYVCLSSGEDGRSAQSLKEPVTKMSPRKLLSPVSGERRIETMRRSFVSHKDGSTAYLDIDIRSNSDADVDGATITVYPSQPIIENTTYFPLRVELVPPPTAAAQDHTIQPGQRFAWYMVPPTPSLQCKLVFSMPGEEYVSGSVMELFSDISLYPMPNPLLIPMSRARDHSHAFDVQAWKTRDALSHAVVFRIVTPRIAFIRNACDGDIAVACVSPTPVYSMTLGGRCSAQCSGHMPLGVGLQLRLGGGVVSDSFELEEGCSGRFVECRSASPSECGFATYVVLRPVLEAAFEFVPPLIIVNNDPSDALHVRQVVRQSPSSPPVYDATVVVPPQAQHLHHILSSGGHVNYFLFGFAEGDSTAFSCAIETDLLPSTTWSGYVRCGSSHRRVDIIKKGLCEPAVMIMSPPQRPRVKLINLTGTSYAQVGAYRIQSSGAPMQDGAALRLNRLDGRSYSVDAKPSVVELEPGVFAHIRTEDGCALVVLRDSTTELFPDNGTSKALSAGTAPLRFDIHIGDLAIKLLDDKMVLLCLSVTSLSAWATYCDALSVQLNVNGAMVTSSYGGTQTTVVEPVSIAVSVRDARQSPTTVTIDSLQTSVSPVVLTVTDLLIYQMQHLGERMVIPPASRAAACSVPTSSWTEQAAHFVPPRRVHIVRSVIQQVQVEVSWDRGVPTPADYAFGNSPLSLLIPSLRHAAFVIPQLQFRQLSLSSVAELVVTVQQIVGRELLKQLPSIVSSVGCFKKDTSLFERIAFRASSLLFGQAENKDAEYVTSLL